MHDKQTCKLCSDVYHALGFCRKHYYRFSKYGDPNKVAFVRDSSRACLSCGIKKHYCKGYCEKCFYKTDYCKNKERKIRADVKYKVLSYYSCGVPTCVCCGETIIEFLTIDHINGGGGKQRSEIKRSGGTRFYVWLIENGFPGGYKTMCWNCNCGRSRTVDKICPHRRG